MLIDNSYYESLGDIWWDLNGPMGLLLRINPVRYQYFHSVISNFKGLRILDIGCGGGFLAEAFASEGAEVHGLDFSPNSLRTTRAHAAKRGINLYVVGGSGESLPFPPVTFDVVVAADILEHLKSPKKAIIESSRVLKPGGAFLYETVNRTFLSRIAVIWMLEIVLRKAPIHTHDWKMFIRPYELMEILRSHGLQNRDLRGLALKDGIHGFLMRIIKGQDPWLFTIGNDSRIGYVGYAIKSDILD